MRALAFSLAFIACTIVNCFASVFYFHRANVLYSYGDELTSQKVAACAIASLALAFFSMVQAATWLKRSADRF